MEPILVAVHVLAAAVWVGGTVALVFVAVPPVQRLEGEVRGQLLREFGRRWRPIGWSALGIAVVTGLGLAAYDHAFDTAPTSFDWVLAVKGALVGILVAGSYLHDYVLGPGLARQIRGRRAAIAPAVADADRTREPADHGGAADPRRGARRAGFLTFVREQDPFRSAPPAWES